MNGLDLIWIALFLHLATATWPTGERAKTETETNQPGEPSPTGAA